MIKKIHKLKDGRNILGAGPSICGILGYNQEIDTHSAVKDKWTKVNCKNCLKSKRR